MKWYQVDSDSPNDPKIKAILRRGIPNPNPQQAAAGVIWLLWCYVANYGAGSEPGLGVQGDGRPLPLNEMATECFVSDDDLRRFLDVLADWGLIHGALWREREIVFLPAMWIRATAYYREKQRPISGYSDPDAVAAAVLGGAELRRPPADPPSDALRQAVYFRDGFTCRYCAIDLSALPQQRCLDHIVPITQGGQTTEDNLVMACKRCNARKIGRTPEQAGMVLLPVVPRSTGGPPPDDGGSAPGGQGDDKQYNSKQVQKPKDQKRSGSADPPPGDLLVDAGDGQVEALVAVWNQERKPGPVVREITPERRRVYQRALKAQPNLDRWRQVIGWLNAQPWCNAKGSGDHPNWRATLDWVAKPGKLAQLLERSAADQPVVSADGSQGRDARRGRVGYKRGEFGRALRGEDDAAIH